MSDFTKVGKIPQSKEENVDGDVKTSEDPRAREGEGEAERLAREIENDAQLQEPGVSFSAMLQKHQRARVLMVAEAVRALGAQQKVWSAKKQGYESAVDYPTRLKAVTILASYSDGLPVQTNVNVNSQARANATTPEQELDRAAASPAAIEAAERQLARLKQRHAELRAIEAKTLESQ